MYSVFEQFEIIKLWPGEILEEMDYSLTNSSLSGIIGVGIVYLLLKGMKRTVVLGRWERFLQEVYVLIKKLLLENMGKEGKQFFPFILTLFVFISILNLLGVVPYGFAPTAHVVITFGLSMGIFIWVVYLGLRNFKLDFFSMFLPYSCPMILGPFIILIEFISYMVRGVTLGLRLAANITAGHLLLGIFAGFVWDMANFSGVAKVFAVLPFALLICITMLEMAMALVQAYVFTLLTVIYLHESYHPH